MPDLTKIATCSYCGTRSVLRLAGKVRHELACAACGARLHDMKPLRAEPAAPRPAPLHRSPAAGRPAKRKPGKSRPARRLRGLFSDFLDEIEDIFD